MGRYFLQVGCLFAVIGCFASVLEVISSVGAIIDGWNTVTSAKLGMPLLWIYAFVMNGALCVVFSRTIARESNPKAAGSV